MVNSFWLPAKKQKVKPVSFFNAKKFPARTKQETKLIDKNPFGDKDRDRVPNFFDCRPLDKKQQGWPEAKRRAHFAKFAKKITPISGEEYIAKRDAAKMTVEDVKLNPSEKRLLFLQKAIRLQSLRAEKVRAEKQLKRTQESQAAQRAAYFAAMKAETKEMKDLRAQRMREDKQMIADLKQRKEAFNKVPKEPKPQKEIALPKEPRQETPKSEPTIKSDYFGEDYESSSQKLIDEA